MFNVIIIVCWLGYGCSSWTLSPTFLTLASCIAKNRIVEKEIEKISESEEMIFVFTRCDAKNAVET